MPTPKLLERERPLAVLAADLAAASGGAGRTVLVSGEAGIGKTSLLEHFVRTSGARRVLWGACDALFTPHPLGPLHDIARDAGGRLKRLLDDDAERAALFDAVLDEIGTAPSPAILVVEDIHWADAATLDLLRFVARRIHRVPALMLLSYRDDELDAAHLLRSILGHLPSRAVSRIALQRLTPDGVAALAALAARDDAGLYFATGGNPFFVIEALANDGAPVPATVRDAVLARAARLDADARRSSSSRRSCRGRSSRR